MLINMFTVLPRTNVSRAPRADYAAFAEPALQEPREIADIRGGKQRLLAHPAGSNRGFMAMAAAVVMAGALAAVQPNLQ